MAGRDLVVNLGLNATSFTRGLTAASAKLSVLGVSAGKTGLMRGGRGLNASFGNLNRTLSMTKGLVAGIGLGLAAMAGKAVSMAAHTEQMRISFEVLTGSAQTGNALFKEMEDLAQSTSLTIAETTQAAKKLMLSFDPRNIKDLVITLGNISSGMDNVSLQDMAMLLQTSREEGTLLKRDLIQFSSRGIGLGKQLKKQFGLVGPNAGEELDAMITRGEVGFSSVMTAITALGKNNMLARQANTLTGAFNQAKDALGLMVRDFGEVLANTLGLTNFLKSLKDGAIRLREAIKSNLPIIEMLIETTRAFGSMFVQVFSDAAATIGILTGVADMSSTQILEGLVVVMAVARSVFNNWRAWGTLAVFAVMLALETFAADVTHLFTTVIPALLKWFGNNWKNVFVLAFMLTMKGMNNLGKNIGEFLAQVALKIKTWGASAWDPMYVGIADGFEKLKKEFGPEDLPSIAPRGKTDLETQLEAAIAVTAGGIVTDMDKEIEDSLKRFRDFIPEAEGPGLGPPVLEQFGDNNSKKKTVDPSKQKLGVMQRGSSKAISAVIKAMGGRDKSPELVELKRQSMMMRYFPKQLAREIHFKELHEQEAI